MDERTTRDIELIQKQTKPITFLQSMISMLSIGQKSVSTSSSNAPGGILCRCQRRWHSIVDVEDRLSPVGFWQRKDRRWVQGWMPQAQPDSFSKLTHCPSVSRPTGCSAPGVNVWLLPSAVT